MKVTTRSDPNLGGFHDVHVVLHLLLEHTHMHGGLVILGAVLRQIGQDLLDFRQKLKRKTVCKRVDIQCKTAHPIR